MGLKEGVIAVVEEMERDAKVRHGEAQSVLLKYSQWLRTLMIVAGDSKPVERQWTPEEQTAILMAKAREEFKGKRRVKSDISQGLDDLEVKSVGSLSAGRSSAELVGGGYDDIPTMMDIDPSMPFGAKILVGNGVFILEQDGKLHYSQKDTEGMRTQSTR